MSFFMYVRAQIKTMMELRMFATTIPHQMPMSPPFNVMAKTRMNSMVKMSVRNNVAINALIPFPTP